MAGGVRKLRGCPVGLGTGGGGGGGRRGAGHGVLGAGETHSVTSPPHPPTESSVCICAAEHCSLALVASVASFREHDLLTRARQAPCGVQELMGDGGALSLPGKAGISRCGDPKIRAVTPRKASEAASSGISWGCCVELALKGAKTSEH